MTHRLPLRPHLLKVPLPPRNTILGSEPRLLICHLIPNGPLNAYSGLSPCMVSEEAPISLTAPGSLGSNLRPCRRWEGGGSQDPQRESSDPGILFQGGGMEERHGPPDIGAA